MTKSASVMFSTEGPSAALHAHPLAVDLDGVLVKTDVSLEALLELLRRNVGHAILCLLSLARGRAAFNREVARRSRLDVSSLPYDGKLVAYLQGERQLGRPVALVSTSDAGLARAVAARLGIFTHVIASENGVSLSVGRRRDLLSASFVGRTVFYATRQRGSAVWEHVRDADVRDVVPGTPQRPPPSDSFDTRKRRLFTWLKALRIHQYAKNTLVFLPLLTSHRLLEAPLALNALIAFASFSLVASSAYLMNDMIDIDVDRRHALKRTRPLAAGDIGIMEALAVCVLCLGAGLGASLLLPSKFRAALALYYVLTVAYSLFLKRRLLVDVHLLAALYTLRVLAGNFATSVPHSSWMLAFSMFFFLSLAFLKRFSEVRDLARQNLAAASGRRYLACDGESLYGLGTSSAFLGVSILALYINSPQVLALYHTPDLLWLLCPLLLYWIGRAWILANRGKMHTDPVLFALKDRVSYGVGLCASIIILLATADFQN
jgi:4-hydroxybenzoate polyprenyltransferase